MDALREKFDCHRQICMCHWDLLFDYPKITKETPEAIDDLIETVRVHLQALERLGDPVTSNAILIKLVTSKLPSAVVREWQHTLPDKKLPPYTHLVDFLKTRTNSDRACSSLTVKKGASDQHDRRRQDAPRSYTFITTHNTLLCPNCHGQHELWNCHVFKTKTPKERLEIAKRASLCTNCLGKGHALTQCSAGSCRICRQRHHTYLHQDQGHKDRKFQQILWRNSDGEVDIYQLNTVTFGLSAAPYLAIRCLKQLADDEGHRYPRAAMVLQRDFYVDDVLTGAETKNEAQSLRTELIELLKLAGLNIRKWAANDRELLRGLSEQDINDKLLLGESQTFKTLGVVWNSFDDSILYSVKINPTASRITKRTISSEIAKIYDPLGLLAPVIVRAKMLLQRLGTLKLDWDESLPADVHTEWSKYYSQLPLLNNVKFPRKAIIKTAAEIELHGFCDASERAYGACVYLRTIAPDGHVWTRLLTARSKVAPLKSQTIPRLELSGALLFASLATTVLQALPSNISRTVYWTDSTIVLHWINTSPHTLKTFVANRVTEIQQKTHTSGWRHIPTTDNPADLISRGQSPQDFLRSTIWQHGPEWLQQPEKYWPSWNPVPLVEIPEQKKATCLSVTPPDHSLLERYSSWPKLIRIAARCFRWRQKQDRGGPLTTHDLTNAHNKLVKLLQLCYFPDEIRTLRTDRNSAVKGKLQRLNPFLDKDEILRVGGRLSHSPMPFTQKHPIILPKSSVTALIIEHEHLLNLHSGTQATLYALRRSYWPIDGRSQVWSTLKKCVRCCRANPPPVEYVMGDLPAARITESLKAVHLELVTDLTSEAFIAALRRFIARRGFCVTIYSDNGTNFVGANNELRELRNLLQSDDHKVRIQSFLADRRIEWHFIPPNSPHFGGLWEAAVKSFKRHLRRVAGNELLTYENLNTLIIEIESILNSRPLTPISSDPNDLLVLTPGHFLIGDALTSFRERDFRDTPSNRLSSWQHIQRIKQHFWRRWHREYLNELNIRNKWSKGSHDIRVGTVVVLREDNERHEEEEMEKIRKIKQNKKHWKYINKYIRSREGIDEDISEGEWRNHLMEILEGTEHKEGRKTGGHGEEEKIMEEREDNIEKEYTS
ncbi:uncharacterized protein LOC125385143 [Bombus terrestris]|uniref:Uncharacterized protein LOC125385143 n=1 Tax=Bombus terrestris TaxID=30195 RepID=A0A9C6S978_BOMTE|nr:uncharacterized protein LOC125385143 [Bombus terrestris]